ncbi:transposase [Streptomyces sp. 11-1-2]|uniref:transposase n=1 Tax=unclassified Streptomyces TaxID=2593676 RepID=UPI001968BFCD|nr:transposase [Streptomyces sp. 11-1-2]
MKHYPAEFKADAVALYRSRPGATIKSVATGLGVNTETLRNWIRAANGRRSGTHSTPAAAPQPGGDAVQAELAAARKRIRELEEERDKAARYFADRALTRHPLPPHQPRAEARTIPETRARLGPLAGRTGGDPGVVEPTGVRRPAARPGLGP